MQILIPRTEDNAKNIIQRKYEYMSYVHVQHVIISSTEPSGSQGELIVYPCLGVRPPFLKIFYSETTWPIKAKFHVEPPCERGTKVYINGPGHGCHVYIWYKPSKIFFSRAGSPMTLTLGIQHQGLKLSKVYMNDYPRLTLTYFKAMSNLVAYEF